MKKHLPRGMCSCTPLGESTMTAPLRARYKLCGRPLLGDPPNGPSAVSQGCWFPLLNHPLGRLSQGRQWHGQGGRGPCSKCGCGLHALTVGRGRGKREKCGEKKES